MARSSRLVNWKFDMYTTLLLLIFVLPFSQAHRVQRAPRLARSRRHPSCRSFISS
jgi:hypothetical protein